MPVAAKLSPKTAKDIGSQPPKNFGGPLRIVAYTFFIFIISQSLAIFLVEVILGLAHPNTTVKLDDSIAGQFGYILLAEALAILGVVTLVRRRGFSLSAIGLGRWPNISDVLKAAL